jgi:uncharacterized protein
VLVATLPQYLASAQVPEVRMGTSFDCSRTGQNIPSLVCQTPELQLADLSQMQVYYTLRHAQPDRQQELRTQFTTRIQTLVRECSTEQVRASGTQSACVARELGELRTFWLQQLERLGNAAALEEARLPPGHVIGSQQALKARNFLPAEAVVDGVFGSGGRQAIAQFQAERGIPSTGFLTTATAESLRNQSNATAPIPPATEQQQQRARTPPQTAEAQPAPLAQQNPPPARTPAPIANATQDQQSQSPIRCGTQNNRGTIVIFCNIMENNVNITEIIVNRGNCRSASQIAAELAIAAQQNSRFSCNRQYDPECGPDGYKTIRGAGAFFALGAPDPRKTWRFGERMTFTALLCPNVLEYTVHANGRQWTWTTQ